MNEFGTPMNEAELSMQPKPGRAFIQEQLATSGMEMQVAGWIICSIKPLSLATEPANKAANAARQQANLSNEAVQRQLAYDLDRWDMDKYKIQADRDHAVEIVQLQAKNEGRVAQYKDATNLQRYNYDMMIRNREQRSLNQQYLRSDAIYNQQLNLNTLSAKTGAENEIRKLQEIDAEARFTKQDAQIEAMLTEGKLRARGQNGRSITKAGQATLADYGRQIAMLNESMSGAGRNTKAVLKEIAQDKTSADLAAWASKMLDPGVLPEPIVPYATPMAEYIYPRIMGEYDFGPQPVLGGYTSPSAAANKVWGSTISSIAGSIGTMGAAGDWKLN